MGAAMIKPQISGSVSYPRSALFNIYAYSKYFECEAVAKSCWMMFMLEAVAQWYDQTCMELEKIL